MIYEQENKALAKQEETDNNYSPGKVSMDKSRPLAIVGIGASAGGLEALEQFLRPVPEKCGLAFVIVQHLDPNHKGIMSELLQRTTGMKVCQVKDRMKVKPDCVYIIPPKKDMSIMHGVLYLFEPSAQRGLRLPIDFFLRSLADDQQQSAIGVVLSGMGADGTLGLRAIKEKAGLVVVQDPASAKFDSMPRSAIDAGVADIIGPAEELPGKILSHLQHIPSFAEPGSIIIKKEQSALEKIILLLRAKTGNDFSYYKKNTLYRRIERRMAIHQLSRIADYVRFLQENRQEAEILFREMLIGVTHFFRDSGEWDLLRDKVIPDLLTRQPKGGTIRAWSVGCSTGEEAYSLAIVFKEALARIKPDANYTLQIFATDLDQDAITKARQGVYPLTISAHVSDERLQRFFIQEETGYRVSKEIRELVTFATQNVIMDPPFTKLNILICRNLLIYLEPELQRKLLPLFHFSLKANGILFLGSSETVGNFASLFKALHARSRLFSRQESALRPETLAFPTLISPALPKTKMESTMPHQPDNLQTLTDQLLLQHFSPPAVLATHQGDILYISGRTGKYLEPAAGKVNWNIFAMARDGLQFELTTAFQKAVRNQESITVKGLKIGVNGGTQTLDLTIQPNNLPEALSGMVLVIFKDVEAAREPKLIGRAKAGAPTNARVTALENELKRSREELQATREGMQSSQEELKSMNEELQSTNEELQSTNEELTTSKEELQSMNEELQTVNAEQSAKMDEFERANSDMLNLLNSTDIVTLFLDNELQIKRFTPDTKKLFKLLDSDIGRPLTDLTNDLNYPELAIDAQSVLKTLIFCEKQVPTNDGRWFTVRIMPYRTTDSRIEGVVLTFSDITNAKHLETKLSGTGAMLRALINATPMIIIGLSMSGEILEFNPVAEQLLERQRDDVIGGDFFELFMAKSDQAKSVADLQVLVSGKPTNSFTTTVVTGGKKQISIQWTTEKILAAKDHESRVVVIGQHIV